VDGKLYGYIDKTGKMVIPPRYYRAVRFSEGLAAVQIGEIEGSSTVGFIDKTGRMVIPPKFYLYLDLTEGHFTDYMGVFSDGLAEVWQDPATASYERAGYIDHTGKFVWIEKKEPQSGEAPPPEMKALKVDLLLSPMCKVKLARYSQTALTTSGLVQGKKSGGLGAKRFGLTNTRDSLEGRQPMAFNRVSTCSGKAEEL
jgi:hypothetical protein